MLPPPSVLTAAHRWLRLLQRSSVVQASVFIRADPRYTDLTPTQYATALDWLLATSLVTETDTHQELSPRAAGLADPRLRELLLERTLTAAPPIWLADADTLVRDPSDLPQDVADLAAALGLDETDTMLAVRRAHGRVDLEARQRVGSAGEAALVALLEQRWPGSTEHVSLDADGLGYDVAFTTAEVTWHLEVKATSRRGRLLCFLSRNEFEVGLLDPNWRLVIVGLGEADELLALATADHQSLSRRSPRDHDSATRWESVRYELGPSDLRPGLTFVATQSLPADDVLRSGHAGRRTVPWMPVSTATEDCCAADG